MLATENPFPQFFEQDGDPLDGGSVHFGVANQNPETNPVAVFWDFAGTQPAVQPIRTVNGYLARNGTPAQVFTAGDYSVMVRNRNGILVFYAPTSTEYSVALAVQTLITDLANGNDAAKGGALIGFSYTPNYPNGTVARRLKNIGIDITQPPFNADKTGAADCSAAFNLALTTYPGIPIFVPAGTYRCDATISINPAPSWGVFGPGARIVGDGVGKTFFDNRVANAPLFDIDSDIHGGTYHANMGTVLEQFQIMTTTSPANSTGIRVLNAWQVDLRQLVIKGMTQDGIELKNGLFADDGWNRVHISQVWLENIPRWGIKADGSAGRNEGSFTRLTEVFFQSCGTAGAATPPTSGAMIWKGQVLVIEDSAAANGCQQVALYIKGEAGLGNSVDIRNFTSENTVGRGIYCSGIAGFKGRNLQVYNNDAFHGTVGIEFNGAAFSVKEVDIDGVIVRATAGNNPYTAFKISGANADLRTCRIKRVVWDNFDYAGQTRFDGWLFDHVEQCCDLVALSAISLLLRPNQTKPRGRTTPLRLRGGAGGTPSTTGEWVAKEIDIAGFGINNGGLAATTRYYAYLYDNNGTPALELSVTVPVQDASTGYSVKTGDATRLYVGSVETDGASQFKLTAGGWLNPVLVPGAQVGVYTYLWGDNTGALRRKYAAAPANDTDGTLV